MYYGTRANFGGTPLVARVAFRAIADSLSSRISADDRLPLASLGRVQGGDGIVESRDVADVRAQSSVPHPLDDLTQLGTIGLDDKVDRQAVGGPRFGRPDDGHQWLKQTRPNSMLRL